MSFISFFQLQLPLCLGGGWGRDSCHLSLKPGPRVGKQVCHGRKLKMLHFYWRFTLNFLSDCESFLSRVEELVLLIFCFHRSARRLGTSSRDVLEVE